MCAGFSSPRGKQHQNTVSGPASASSQPVRTSWIIHGLLCSQKFLKCCTTITAWIFYNIHREETIAESRRRPSRREEFSTPDFLLPKSNRGISPGEFVFRRPEIILVRVQEIDVNSMWSSRYWSATESASIRPMLMAVRAQTTGGNKQRDSVSKKNKLIPLLALRGSCEHS